MLLKRGTYCFLYKTITPSHDFIELNTSNSIKENQRYQNIKMDNRLGIPFSSKASTSIQRLNGNFLLGTTTYALFARLMIR